MSKTKQKFFGRFSQQQLLVALLLIVAVGGLVYWRSYSANPPKAIESSANEEPLHWFHSTTPFKLSVNNYAGSSWEAEIQAMGDVWSKSGMINFGVIPGRGKFQCIPIQLPPTFDGNNVCSYSENDGWLSIRAVFGQSGSPHITAGLVVLNDYYLSNPKSEYSAKPWRNKMLCTGLGWTTGMPVRIPKEYPTSCMNYETNSDTIEQQQYPSKVDIEYMKEIYKHIDYKKFDQNNIGITSIPKQTFSKDNLGQLIDSSTSNGVTTDTYQLDLTDGYYFRSVVNRIEK